MKRLSKLFPILLFISCTCNDAQLQDYYELRKDNFFISGLTVDLEENMKESELAEKPILFYFNSLACVNCRNMEEWVLDNRRIAKKIAKNFLLVPLTVDDKTKIPEEEQQWSRFTGRMMKTVGQTNSGFQLEIFQYGSQPYFAVMNVEKEILGKIGYTSDKKEFLHFLKSSIKTNKLSKHLLI